MENLDDLFARKGGAVATHELLDLGMSARQIRARVEAGRIFRARQGWYVLPRTAPIARQAVRVGGVVTCAVALESHGLWAVHDSRLHVRVDHAQCRLRTPHDRTRRLSAHPDTSVVVHWNRSRSTSSRLIASPIDALLDWKNCAGREWALAAANDLVRNGHPDAARALDLLGATEFDGVDGTCESGTEVIFYRRMLSLGLAPWRQVPVPGAGRLDFLFGTSLVVEVDGRTFHDTADAFAADRRKDAILTARGGRVLRFSHDQVLYAWPDVIAALRGALPSAYLSSIH